MAKANIIRKQLPNNIPEHVKRKLMGTQASDVAPWQSYTAGDPLAGLTADQRAEITEYSKKHHGSTSTQNVEELARQKELSAEFVKEYKMYRQEELQDTPERVGRIMHCLDFLKLLETIRPAYLSANIRKGLTGLGVYHPMEVTVNGEKTMQAWHYVCAVQVGYMHEYSSMWFDSRGLPLNEKWRGWRTVLLRLIQLGHVTEEQALAVFGEPSPGGARRYKEQLYCWRNRDRKDDGKPLE